MPQEYRISGPVGTSTYPTYLPSLTAAARGPGATWPFSRVPTTYLPTYLAVLASTVVVSGESVISLLTR